MKNYSYEHFGRDGSYRGYKVREGNIAKYYDAQGHYKGWRDYTTGTYHDAQGHLMGRRDSRGYSYDAQGRLKGRSVPRSGKSSSGGGIFGFFKRMFSR